MELSNYQTFDFSKDPLDLFLESLNEAGAQGVIEPTAMSLSTINAKGRPSSRMVLFKGLARGGFSFYTNYQSPKSQHLLKNPFASLVFFWPQLQQQIRIEGQVEKLTDAESDQYFQSRPRESQIGAWASDQSEVIPNTDYLKSKFAEVEQRFQGQQVLRPPYWGGFAVKPELIEFWYGKVGRLHERFVFEKNNQSWKTSQKSP